MKFESNEKHLWLVRMKPCESALFSLSPSLSSRESVAARFLLSLSPSLACVFVCVRFARESFGVFGEISHSE
jgi:hypothetical protein